jgi:hypothetical protein
MKTARGRSSLAPRVPAIVIEEFSAARTLGVSMQVGDKRNNGDDIKRLYDSSEYPKRRRKQPLADQKSHSNGFLAGRSAYGVTEAPRTRLSTEPIHASSSGKLGKR